MKYNSTRGLEKGLSFENVLLAGYAKDQGLYMPQSIPKLNLEELQEWKEFSYQELVYHVLRKFICKEEIKDSDLKDIVSTSFKRFDHPSVIGIQKFDTFSIFELFHGPTLAFKDIALLVVSELLDHLMQKRSKHLIALVGTSGDTGSSAMESIRGRDNIDIVVLFPKDRCSTIQRRQMTTIRDKNTFLFGVDGTSDDLDLPIKQCFEDKDFVAEHNLISLNSINMGRILAQIPMYIFAYYHLANKLGEQVEIVVPTGAAGSITAGCIAHKMGFPIRLVAAVNANQVVARALREGTFSISKEVHRTFSNAMDIQVPYNIERLFYLFSDFNSEKVKAVMKGVECVGRASIPEDILTAMRNTIIDSYVVSDEEGTAGTAKLAKEYGYVICPHTATGVSYVFSHSGDIKTTPRGVFATASPEKFPEASKSAGIEPPQERVKHILEREESFTEMKKGEDWLRLLKEKIIAISSNKKQQ